MRIGQLCKIIDSATRYTTEANRAYVVELVGTNSTTEQMFKVDGKDITNVIDPVTPLTRPETNLWGPLPLGDERIVIPPDTVFETVGATGQLLKLYGKIYVLEAGEALPADLVARAEAQVNVHRRYYPADWSLATDETWVAGREHELAVIQAPVGERWTFDQHLGISWSNVTVAQGTIGVRLTAVDMLLDNLKPEAGRLGIDAYNLPFPPTTTTSLDVFSLKQTPIVLDPGRKLVITAVNTSGANLTPPAGTAISAKLVLTYKREKV